MEELDHRMQQRVSLVNGNTVGNIGLLPSLTRASGC